MSVGVHFGIDTSNYTTSAAAVTDADEVFCAKRPLTVPAGERGLRQSDALFCHTRDLHQVIFEVTAQLNEAYSGFHLLSVAAAETPRRAEGSYMPCFLAGVNAAKAAALMANVPYRGFSHQEGHIEAARFGAKRWNNPLTERDFYAFHLSGGTTEFLRVTETEGRYEVSLVAEALDITCGQFIDRCGVKMGLPFPSGAPLEELALASPKKFNITIPRKENGINLSGFENRFDALLKEGSSQEEAAGFVFAVTEKAVEALMEYRTENLPILFSGGVSSSRILKNALEGQHCHFAAPTYTADNAVGIALLSRKGANLGA